MFFSMDSKWIKQFATGFGVGLAPKAPGTFGTLLAIPLWYALTYLSDLLYITIVLALIVFAIQIADLYEKQTVSHDPSHMVIDEIVGFLVTMALLPIGWKSLLLGFILFRVLDIWKPWPVSHFNDKVKGGFGAVLDDVVAGMIANLVLHILFRNFSILN